MEPYLIMSIVLSNCLSIRTKNDVASKYFFSANIRLCTLFVLIRDPKPIHRIHYPYFAPTCSLMPKQGRFLKYSINQYLPLNSQHFWIDDEIFEKLEFEDLRLPAGMIIEVDIIRCAISDMTLFKVDLHRIAGGISHRMVFFSKHTQCKVE